MEELTRVDPNEDPYLALRTALSVAICVILADPLGVTQPMMPVVLGMSLMSNQRGALNVRSFMGPVMLPVMAFVFSWLAAATVSEPMLFVLMNVVLAGVGIALMLFKGSRLGVMLTVFPAMMSMSVLYSDQALVAIRDSMATGGLIVGVTAVVLNILFPPQTDRVHVEQPKPFETEKPARRAADPHGGLCADHADDLCDRRHEPAHRADHAGLHLCRAGSRRAAAAVGRPGRRHHRRRGGGGGRDGGLLRGAAVSGAGGADRDHHLLPHRQDDDGGEPGRSTTSISARWRW